jgi:phosphatidate cytidylyltransferase
MLQSISDVMWPAVSWLNPQRLDNPTIILLAVVLALLTIAYVVGVMIRRHPDSTLNPAIVDAFNVRVRAWWLMFLILTASFLLGKTVTVILFFLVSFWALREFITLTPTRMGDHRTLFLVFFLFAPLQYFLVAFGSKFYELYSIFIPVYVYLFIPARIALAGDFKRFLERAAKIQAAILICVYALSHAPALLYLEFRTSDGSVWHGSHEGVLFFFILIVQVADVLQYVWSKVLGRHVIVPKINTNRTWEGFTGSVFSTSLIGAILYWATPFTPAQAALMSLITAISGFAGGLTMSAIKRDRGVQDYGTLVVGHAGILDRIDSLCFAAPVFFHLTRYLFSQR